MKRNVLKKVFGKLFLKKINVNSEMSGKYQVQIINDNVTTMPEALGMSKERADYLYSLVKATMHESENEIEVCVKVSSKCTHANELYFVAVTSRGLSQALTNPMYSLLEMFTSGRKK